MSKLKIAVIGSGLASAMLARQLRDVADVTIFERGSASPEKPHHVEIGQPLGLSPSYGHGHGGTTNYWAGGLLRLRPGEVGAAWPAGLMESLRPHEMDVVTALYGAEVAEQWAARIPSTVEGELFLDCILKPQTPFRAAQNNFFDGVNLRLHHQVVSVREENGGAVVEYRVEGKMGVASFDRVILAAGNIGSSLILQQSELGGPNVGRNLTDHPMGFVAKLTAHGANRFKELEITSHGNFGYDPMLKVKDQETGLWTSIYLRPTSTSAIYSDPYKDGFPTLAQTNWLARTMKALEMFGNADFRAQAFAHVLNRANNRQHVYVMVVAEQEPLGQGTVVEENGVVKLDWSISDATVGSIKRSVIRAAEWAGGASINWYKGDLKDRLWSAAHHSGGCRISADITTGVVDANLLVHGTNAVYVCDGSVLPSTGSTNTGLTIGCLALRLAAQLSSSKFF